MSQPKQKKSIRYSNYTFEYLAQDDLATFTKEKQVEIKSKLDTLLENPIEFIKLLLDEPPQNIRDHISAIKLSKSFTIKDGRFTIYIIFHISHYTSLRLNDTALDTILAEKVGAAFKQGKMFPINRECKPKYEDLIRK